MAISSGSLISQADINSIFTSFNSFIASYGGGIAQISGANIPAIGSEITDEQIAILNGKINEFKADTYLKTKDWWLGASISEGDLAMATNLGNITQTVTNFASVKCRNQATNNYSTNGNCCNSNNKSVSCSHSTNGNCCNSNNKSVSCSHSTNGNCCNSNNKSVGCSHSTNTVGHSCTVQTPCQFICAQNPENCTWGASGYGPKDMSGGPHAWAGFTVSAWACYQYSNCQYGCLYYANTYGGTRYPTCAGLWCNHTITCSNTCNQSCSNSNHGQTCGNTCNQSCANNNHGQTCSNTCNQSCANTNYNQTCSNTKTIDITCQQSTKSYSH